MNLNIDKFSKNDLLDIFNIPQDEEISYNFIENKCQNYISRVTTDQRLSIEKKQNLSAFLNAAMTKLMKLTNTIENNHLETNIIDNNHLVIQKNKKNDLTSNINPLTTNKIYKFLNINTIFRKNYYNTKSSDFTIDLNDNINNVTSIALESAEIPKLFYKFSSLNKTNEFTIETFDMSNNQGSSPTLKNKKTHVIKIKDGNYTPEQLSNYLNKFVFGIRDNELSRITTKYDEITGKFYFIRDNRPTENGGIVGPPLSDTGIDQRFNIDFRISTELNRPIQLNIGWILGYRKQYYSYDEDFITESSANTIQIGCGYTPESMFDTTSSKYLFLAIDDFNNNYSQSMISPFQDSVFNNNMILAKLVDNGSNYNFRNQQIEKKAIRHYFGPVNINKLKITILDELGRIVDFNNSDYSLSLRIEQMYDLNTH